MARIQPFSALRYDLGRVHASDVLTQPYDKISPIMRQQYLAKSPYNLVRVILGEARENDTPQNNVYTRAADYLQSWTEQGILRTDPEPGIYAYTQTFTLPGQSARMTRRGFITLGALEEYENRVVYRHEQTLSGPKQDRQALLRATRTHFGQIFMLYSDPSQATEAELLARAQNPVLDTTDEYGTEHRLYRETDAGVIARLQQRMAHLPLIIADGHHRYETALAWRREQNGQAPHRADHPWDWVMMTCINLDAPGLVVLPTHRVVYGLPGWKSSASLEHLREWFAVEETTIQAQADRARWETFQGKLAAAGGAGPAIGLALADYPHFFLLRPRAELNLVQLLPDALPEQRQLDVLLLHRLGLERGLGISAEMVREQRHLRYAQEAVEALQSVRAGAAQAVFLLNPIAPGQVRDVALAGGTMPQKSTDFFPKLLTGLTLYKA